MLSYAHAVAVPASPEPIAGTLDWIGAIEDDDHVLVLGGYGPGVMCALLRAGATRVTHLRAHERPEAGSASLAIVPQLPSTDWLATALPSIRRALTAGGRLVVRGGMRSIVRTEVLRILNMNGFTAVRVSNTAGGDQVFNAGIRAPLVRQAA
jgi:hypothetical protein